jgi:hypothetical protein
MVSTNSKAPWAHFDHAGYTRLVGESRYIQWLEEDITRKARASFHWVTKYFEPLHVYCDGVKSMDFYMCMGTCGPALIMKRLTASKNVMGGFTFSIAALSAREEKQSVEFICLTDFGNWQYVYFTWMSPYDVMQHCAFDESVIGNSMPNTFGFSTTNDSVAALRSSQCHCHS